MVSCPETRYARSDDVHIAYQVVGDGPLDLVLVHGWVSNVEHSWTEPALAAFQQRLASSHRLIILDKRGTGLSDRAVELPTMERRMDDVRAVMDAAGSERAVVVGLSEGGPLCALFAAMCPERTRALILYGSYAKRIWSPDYPWAPTLDEQQVFYETVEREWGGAVELATLAPSMARDSRFSQWFASWLRTSASPGGAVALARLNSQVDIRRILPAIRVPTLVVHRVGDRAIPVGCGRHLARAIPEARYVELPGDDHLPWVGDPDSVLRAVEGFLASLGEPTESEHVLTTVLCCSLTGAPRELTAADEVVWGDRIELVSSAFSAAVTRFRGRCAVAVGAELAACFDGPARAISCGIAVRDDARRAGIALGAGLHVGDCAVGEGRLEGLARDVAARVARIAQPGRVLVSSTLRDLMAGSDAVFSDRGAFAIRGLGQSARLYEVKRYESGDRVPEGRALGDRAPTVGVALGNFPGAAGRYLRRRRSGAARELTERQLEILRLVAEGLPNQEIAQRLGLSDHTVHRHLANILMRLGVQSRAAAAAVAVRGGLI